MNARANAFIASAASMWIGLLSAAEDHSQHQHEPPPVDEHAEHRMPPPNVPPSSSDEHAQHQDRTQVTDEHAAHRAPSTDEPTESERAHIPPDPPQLVLGDMSNERMIELMQMEDDAPVGMLLLDQLEWREVDDEDAHVWEAQAWYGDDYNKLWLKTEGERADDETEGRIELLWDRITSRWWSVQAGLRQDFSTGPSRTWASVGVQGLAPYFFEVEATVYVGEEGRTAARFSGEYDLLITQRLILQPEIEFEWFGRRDPQNAIGAGLSDMEAGLRLRYEIRRELAPYIGVHWQRTFGDTARMARAEGHDPSDIVFVAGLRAWF